MDRVLFTRPLFETLLFENDYGRGDRRVVIALTLKAVVRYRWRQLSSALGEACDILLFRIAARGRVPRSGMTPVLPVGDLLWHQVTDWRVAQRVRRTFGRIGRRSDCTTLYCGWRNELTPGEPLPVFVLLDGSSKVREVVYADMGEDDIVEALTLGTGSHLRPCESDVIPAIGALALHLEVENVDVDRDWS